MSFPIQHGDFNRFIPEFFVNVKKTRVHLALTPGRNETPATGSSQSSVASMSWDDTYMIQVPYDTFAMAIYIHIPLYIYIYIGIQSVRSISGSVQVYPSYISIQCYIHV